MYTTWSCLIQSPDGQSYWDDQSRDYTISIIIYACKCFSEQISLIWSTSRSSVFLILSNKDFCDQVLQHIESLQMCRPLSALVLFIIMKKRMSHLSLRNSLHFLCSSAAIIVDKMYHCSGAHKLFFPQQNLSRKDKNVAVCFSSRTE